MCVPAKQVTGPQPAQHAPEPKAAMRSPITVKHSAPMPAPSHVSSHPSEKIDFGQLAAIFHQGGQQHLGSGHVR